MLNRIWIKYDEQRYLSQFVAKMFGSLRYVSTRDTPLYEFKIFVTMATY